MSDGTDRARASLEQLSASLQTARAKLSGFQQQLSKDLGDAEGLKRYAASVEASKRSVYDLAKELETAAPAATSNATKLSGGLAAVSKGLEFFGHAGLQAKAPLDTAKASLQGFGTGLSQFVSAARGLDVRGAVDGLTEGLAGAAKSLDILVPGLGQATSAVIKFGGAIAGGVADKIQDALEKGKLLESQFEALGLHGEGSGKKVLGVVKDLAAELPQGKGQIVEWVKKFEALGVTDLGQLKAQVRATAAEHALMGDAGVQALDMIQNKLRVAQETKQPFKLEAEALSNLYKAGLQVGDISKRMGLTAADLATQLKAGTVNADKFGVALRDALVSKGAGPLEATRNTLGSIRTKLDETGKAFFAGIDAKPLAEALRGIIAIGDQGQPSGQAMKVGLADGINAVIKLMAKGVVEGEVLFLRIEVLALQAYLSMLPLIGAFETVAGYAGKVKDFVLPSAPEGVTDFKTAGPGALARGAEVADMAGRGVAIGNALSGGLLGPLAGIVTGGIGLLKSMADETAREVARESGAQLGQATVAGMKDALEMHSPSRVGIAIGRNLSASVGTGVEVEAPAVARATRAVSGHALGGFMRGPGGAFSGGGAGIVVHIGSVQVTAPEGVTDANTLGAFGISVALERMQLTVGR